MTDDPVSLFVNPTAGRGRAGDRLPVIQDLFAAANVPLRIVPSSGVGDLEEKVAEHVAGVADHIIVVGGDGSIHEAVNGIQRANTDTILSVIPSGTGNDFAKASGLSSDWREAAQALLARMQSGEPARAVDLGRVNDRYFANGVGIGFDAKVTRVARSIHWPIGDLVYLVALLRCLAGRVATPEFDIRGSETLFSGAVTMAAVCNGAWVGGLFHIAPPADNTDGQLNLLVASSVSRARILRLLPKLMRGEHLGEKEVSHDLVDGLTITSSAPVESHIDGEVQPMQQHFEFQVFPGQLKLL
jgi:diacylglycerol kinase (ATP)